MSRIGKPHFVRYRDGKIVIKGQWPEHIAVTDRLIATADPRFLFEQGAGSGVIQFNVYNGMAVYRLVDKKPGEGRYMLCDHHVSPEPN